MRFLRHLPKLVLATLLATAATQAQESPADVVEGVRGKGLLLGLACKVVNTDLRNAALDQGLVTITAGDNVLRLLPPLNLTDDDITAGLEKLHAACSQLSKGQEAAA